MWVKISHHRAGGVQVLEKQEHEGEFIQQVDSKDNAPECRVGADKWTITKLYHREHKEASDGGIRAPAHSFTIMLLEHELEAYTLRLSRPSSSTSCVVAT
jgi:hypothetical protein